MNTPNRPEISGRGSSIYRLLPYVLLIAAIWIIPHYVPGYKPSAEGRNYQLNVLVFIGINTILAVGLNLLMGYAGQVSLGHAAFYGLGAYMSAVLTTQGIPQDLIGPVCAALAMMASTAAVISLLRVESVRLWLSTGGFAIAALCALHFGPRHWLPYVIVAALIAFLRTGFGMSIIRLALSYVIGAAAGLGALALFNHIVASGPISPWYGMLVGATFACLVAYLIGGQAMRLQGYYLAMATLGFGVIVAIVLVHWEAVTGGTSGVYAIPNLQAFKKPLDNDITMYYLVWAVAVVAIILSANIVKSRVGRAFRAVHGSELAANSLGVDTARYKVQVFVLSAGMASLAGSLYAHYVTFISPDPFGFKFSVELVVMVVVGGLASVWGPLVGAAVITELGVKLQNLTDPIGPLHLVPADFDVIIFGVILMLIMIYLPSGIVKGAGDGVSLITGLFKRLGGKRSAGGSE